jgi:ABC-type histidine transport system ATPase subunit
MSALELVNIRKRYGNVETLKGIDLSLASGEFLVLVWLRQVDLAQHHRRSRRGD